MALALIRVKQIQTPWTQGDRINLHGLHLTLSFCERVLFDLPLAHIHPPKENLCNRAAAVLSDAINAIKLANAKRRDLNAIK